MTGNPNPTADAQTVDRLTTALDQALDNSIVDLTEDERDALTDALAAADQDYIGGDAPDEDGVLYHDGEWVVITSDKDIFRRYIGDLDFEEDLAVNLLQYSHNRAAEDITGDYQIASACNVFVYRAAQKSDRQLAEELLQQVQDEQSD